MNINELDAVAQGAAVRAGDISARELVQAAAEKSEAIDRKINHMVTELYEQALLEATEIAPEGVLAGVPVLLKDFLATCEGVRHTEGSKFLRDYVATQDSEYVRRLRHAGAVILGVVSTPEMAAMSTCEPHLFGPTRNPWLPDRTPGGSSGASAAAIAAGVVPAAHGNDAAGSIRIPASCCGVFGLKPTRARNPLGPEHGDLAAGLWTEHVLTRSVRDSAAFLDVTGGGMMGDPYAAPSGPASFLDECEAEPARLRIGYSSQTPTRTTVAPECRAAVEQAAEALEELGHFVVEGEPEFDAELAERELFTLFCEGVAARVDSWSERLGQAPSPGDLEPLTEGLMVLGRQRSGAAHLLGIERIQREARKIARFFEAHDAWLTPTLGMSPVELGYFDLASDDGVEDFLRRDAEFSPFTWIANLTGQPAMSYPLCFEAGVPIGVHVMGRFGDELTLLRLALQLERVHPIPTAEVQALPTA